MRLNVIGIDSGVKGAIAYRTADGWTTINLPAKDGEKLAEALEAAGCDEHTIVYLEDLILARENGPDTVQVAARNYGRLEECIRRTGAEVHAVNPRTWRAKMGMTGWSKAQIQAIAQKWAVGKLTQRNADAVAIAEYGTRQHRFRQRKAGRPLQRRKAREMRG